MSNNINTTISVRFGGSGLRVSPFILGMMSYGSSKWQDWVLDEEESLSLMKQAYDSGIFTWDTANTYSNGDSERLVKKAMDRYKIPRDRLVILTKCYFAVADDNAKTMGLSSEQLREKYGQQYVNRSGLSRKHIFDAVDASLERLGTDYIDVLQIHRLDRETPFEEIAEALHDVVKSGKVRYVGASSMACWEFMSLNHIAEKRGWTKLVSMQNFHNLLYREEEREMMKYCEYNKIAVIPWSSLARGMLTRPWSQSKESTRANSDAGMRWVLGKSSEEIVNAVEKVAKRKGVKMAQVALAWSMTKVTAPIIGVNKPERLIEALESLTIQLTEEDMKELEEPYAPRPVVGY
ncbi:hypothetical protein PROFUN_13008 [Planoprotostelium fungivorum]|uniref:NADP-dependent oxidoreductase domain-containing protein n=1 Tax=Planoprotostelium fungivorum TaxID=1890364 RepID=A0A2P6N5U2_9EUKA|nr:hypothetical protein PROFUN_13008 [Planoprotostelium fungivorum]